MACLMEMFATLPCVRVFLMLVLELVVTISLDLNLCLGIMWVMYLNRMSF